jgi:two-component system chemotaxis response regulator CheB
MIERYGDHAANERTFLAWVRTAIAIMVFGFLASHPAHGQGIVPRHIYVAPPDHHMRLTPGFIHLDTGPKIHFTRPAADPLFQSAALAYGARVVGVVLSGGGGDGTAGLRDIKARGGISIVQEPDQAENPGMPLQAIKDDPDYCLRIAEIGPLLVSGCALHTTFLEVLGKLPV